MSGQQEAPNRYYALLYHLPRGLSVHTFFSDFKVRHISKCKYFWKNAYIPAHQTISPLSLWLSLRKTDSFLEPPCIDQQSWGLSLITSQLHHNTHDSHIHFHLFYISPYCIMTSLLYLTLDLYLAYCMCISCSVVSSLCDPMDYGLAGSSVHGIFQARILELVAIPFSRGIFPTQGSNLGLPHCNQISYHLSILDIMYIHRNVLLLIMNTVKPKQKKISPFPLWCLIYP